MLTIATLASVVFGVIFGLILRGSTSSKWTERQIMYINFIGELFLRMLKGLILPLVISSLIAAIGTLNFKATGKIGGRAISYYLITTFMAVVLGIILVLTIRPGIDRHESKPNQTPHHTNSKLRSTTTTDTMLDLIRNMFPPNIIQACLEQYQTVLKPSIENANSSKSYKIYNYYLHSLDNYFLINFFTYLKYLADINDWSIGHIYGNGMNIIGLGKPLFTYYIVAIAIILTKLEQKIFSFIKNFMEDYRQ